jgi:predicted amidohydrolase YtcJ
MTAADLAVLGARIRTMDPDRPWASALAVRDGVLVAVGDDDEVRSACDARTTVLDGAGSVVTPGLVDGHHHLFMGAEVGRGVDLDRVRTLDRMRELLRAERERVGPGGWLLGFAAEYETFGGPYHHSLLDEAAGDGPMLLWALDLHTAFVNAEGLRVAGITGPIRFGDNSFVVLDDAGAPTGELREMSAIEVALGAMPAVTAEQRGAWYVDAIRRHSAVGLTAVHLMDGDLDTVELLASLEAEGELGLRVLLHQFVHPYTEDEQVEAMLRVRDRRGRRWQADGVKLMVDGVIDTGTAWLEQADSHGDGTASFWPEFERYGRRVRAFHDAGFRIATHAIGDRAAREVLDVYAGLPGGSAGRHRIEHIETAPDRTVARFAPERVTASMQPVHLRWLKPDLSDPWSERAGHERCSHVMRSGDLSAAGALVVLGSDWPVAPFDPRFGFFAAQQRRAHDVDDPRPLGASRPLTGEETLAGYTVNPARAVGDALGGMLREGFRADLVGWAEDPAGCPVADVVELPVHFTVVDGEVVHRA